MSGYNPGDILIDDLTVTSPRSGSWQAAPYFISAEITETIFTPVVLAYIEVLDDKDWLGQLKIAGDEMVTFTYRNPAGTVANYEFHLNSVKDIGIQGALKSKTYKLECVTREPMHAQVNYVQRSYNTTIGEMVADIIMQDFKSKKKVNYEPTKGKRKFVVPNEPALQWVDKMKAEAVSEKNKGSNYMFWQTHRGFYFQSLEYMMQQRDVKTFKQENTIGSSMRKIVDTNILSWQVKQNMDASNRIHSGVMGHRVVTFDPHTHKYVSQDFKPKANELTGFGKGFITTLSSFLDIFAGGVQTHFRMVNPNVKIDVEKSHVPGTIPYKELNIAQMQEQSLHMTVIGDPNLEPGKTIRNNVPKIVGTTSSNQLDAQVSGRWLISKVTHEIRQPQARPRWVSNLECLKGTYEESV